MNAPLTDTAGRSQSRSEKPLGSLQNARRLIEEAQKDLDAARHELGLAQDSQEDLTLRAALSHLSSAHVCVAGTLHRSGVADKAKATRETPRVWSRLARTSEG